jgi:hypothetical protein
MFITGNDVAFFTKAFEILAECMLKKTQGRKGPVMGGN